MDTALVVDCSTGDTSLVPEDPRWAADRAAEVAAQLASEEAAAAAKDQAVATLKAAFPANVFDAILALSDNLNQ